jgi:glutaredoxin 3
MPEVEIYTRLGCGYCTAALALLHKVGARYVEHDVSARPELRAEMVSRSSRNTFPQIFIAGRHVGGCDDLYELHASGRLMPLLASTVSP